MAGLKGKLVLNSVTNVEHTAVLQDVCATVVDVPIAHPEPGIVIEITRVLLRLRLIGGPNASAAAVNPARYVFVLRRASDSSLLATALLNIGLNTGDLSASEQEMVVEAGDHFVLGSADSLIGTIFPFGQEGTRAIVGVVALVTYRFVEGHKRVVTFYEASTTAVGLANWTAAVNAWLNANPTVTVHEIQMQVQSNIYGKIVYTP